MGVTNAVSFKEMPLEGVPKWVHVIWKLVGEWLFWEDWFDTDLVRFIFKPPQMIYLILPTLYGILSIIALRVMDKLMEEFFWINMMQIHPDTVIWI